MLIFKTLKWFFNIIFREREDLVVENLALRQQLAVFTRTGKKPKLKIQDRFFWVWLSKVWKDWPSVFLIVKPNTIIKWHRMGFRFYWRWKSRKSSPGRPKIAKEIIALIRRMSRENITLGVPRILAELKLLGYNIAESTVTKYMIRHTKPPSQTWRTFLKNHMHNTAAIDFFTVYTASFKIFFCFLVLSNDRRKVFHFNVGEHPMAEWTIQQMREAFTFNEAPKSPWQNPFAERIIGPIRRDCLDHVIVFSQNHLLNILKEYFAYYHNDRPHQ